MNGSAGWKNGSAGWKNGSAGWKNRSPGRNGFGELVFGPGRWAKAHSPPADARTKEGGKDGGRLRLLARWPNRRPRPPRPPPAARHWDPRFSAFRKPSHAASAI